MSKLSIICIYYLSFLPLWISILFVDSMSIYDKNDFLWTEYISIGAICVLTLISLLVLKISFSTKRRSSSIKLKIANVIEEKTITSEYLLSYILPLFAFDFTQWRQIVLFLVFFLTLGILCVKHNHFSTNIILEVFGYRFYRCELVNEDNKGIEKLIVSKEPLINHKNEYITTRAINNEFSLDLLDW